MKQTFSTRKAASQYKFFADCPFHSPPQAWLRVSNALKIQQVAHCLPPSCQNIRTWVWKAPSMDNVEKSLKACGENLKHLWEDLELAKQSSMTSLDSELAKTKDWMKQEAVDAESGRPRPIATNASNRLPLLFELPSKHSRLRAKLSFGLFPPRSTTVMKSGLSVTASKIYRLRRMILHRKRQYHRKRTASHRQSLRKPLTTSQASDLSVIDNDQRQWLGMS